MIDDAVFAARQIKILLYGNYKKRLPVRLFMYSESTVESVASSRQVEMKSLPMTV